MSKSREKIISRTIKRKNQKETDLRIILQKDTMKSDLKIEQVWKTNKCVK